nr:Chain B, FxxYF motif peptide [synthetic construct]
SSNTPRFKEYFMQSRSGSGK